MGMNFMKLIAAGIRGGGGTYNKRPGVRERENERGGRSFRRFVAVGGRGGGGTYNRTS